MRMRALRTSLAVLIALWFAGQPAVRAQGGLLGGLGQTQAEPAGFSVQVSLDPPQQAPGGRTLVRVRFQVAAEHYVWRKNLSVELGAGAPPGIRAGDLILPRAKQKYDKYASETVDYYDGEFTVVQVLEVGKDVVPGDYDVPLLVRYTGCSPDLCAFGRHADSVRLRVAAGEPAAVALPQAAPAAPAAGAAAARQAAAGANPFAGRSLLGAVLVAFLAGLALLLTPCVYPLIPITISLMGATAGRSRMDGLVRSLVYVFGISVTYSVAGVVTAAGGAQFGAWLQQPAVYVALAVVFVLLAGAMLGVYTLDLSSQRLQRLQVGLRGKGGLLGIWVVGVLSGAAATACIAPIIVFALLYVAQQGSLLLGFLLFFAMAWGMGAPLVVLGTFTGVAQALPKSGEWLNTVKRAFGLALLGVAVYYVGKSRLLSGFWFDMLEGAFLLGTGVFVGAFDVLSVRSGWWPRLRKTAGLLLLVAAAGVFLQLVRAPQPAEAIRWVDSESQALTQARAEGKPLLIDFWADWCVPCHRMFMTTYVDPRVVAESRRFVMARVDTEGLSRKEQDDLRQRYGVMGVPTTVWIGTDGSVRSLADYIGPDRMLELMQAALPGAGVGGQKTGATE